ncbi:Cse1-domain-containing protein [Alternaria alternata]|jgi:exportin-2 (importin alpha re-exporter)|uniref:Cse1-domain-containing protein n=3 Tax=Alternaria sect. Alternaria TaxID=2499237 RepID=A0A177DD07_ALTAL|nr:Cse1-domain-containing protein [Alternaria alternata]KAB2104976.1 Importin alpha re-exporter [Alternaria gaisen]RYN31581.1 Importin alpha re-exporter [Alternaria tenuissima]KAH6846510.1 CAS/CSE protein [Alternaria alternata]OAG17386.1 Cse1-domain-containing protein [Alternaria alternata]OWY51057.1 Cse1-like protein [Alternaria alternata]
MAADIATLSQLLQASLDPRQNKQAEEAITQEQTKPGFSLTLLQIVASDANPQTTRLSAALYFKNFIKRNWVDEDGNYKLPESEVVAIKRELIGLMVSVPANLQAQLGEAISAIADSDFWQRWDTLVDDLISRLTPDNTVVNNGVLQVAHSIFKRWRPLFRSDDLFTEINHVLSKFGTPFLQLLENTDTLITNSQGNPQVLKNAFTTLDLLIKLFYDLSCQDLPPVFEDHIAIISGLLHKYLVFDNPALHTDDDTESGPQEYVRAGIFEALMLYIQKYEDVFGSQLGQFIESTWSFLMSVGLETKYDILVSKALQFLTAVASTQHAEAFNNQSVLVQIIEKVILPNLTLRESDVELFEDEPIEFIRRDLEGSDNDTRRRAATNFLRQLMTRFETLVTTTSQTYIDAYLQNYAQDSENNWKSKDTAVYLFTAIAAKGTATAGQGVMSVNENVNILEFFQTHIAADLQAQNVSPILKVDAIKFLYVFRSQLSPDLWRAAFPLLVNQLGNDNYVIHTYAAIAVERALYMTDSNRQPIIPKADVVGSSKDLLTHLFKLITKSSAPEKIQENEFLMKCVMRVLIFIRDGVLPICETILQSFINIVKVIRHNPSNPRFQYYMFEGIGALVRFCAPKHPQFFEEKLYEPFAACLQANVEEFSPYIFQLFSALLEANPSSGLSEYYRGLFVVIIQGAVWEQRGNVPALARLLSAMVARDAENIVATKQLEPILGIFQKLVTSKAHETYSFELIEAVVAHIPANALQPYFSTILQLMLTRLSNMKTENFQQRFIAFYHFVSARLDKGLGTDFFIEVSDQIQKDIFKPIYLTVILPDTQKLARPTDRKTAVVSFTKTLGDSQAFVDRYPKGWALTTQRLVELLVNPPVPTSADDIIPDADVDELGFGVGFTQLNTCKKAPRDPFPEITNVKEWVGNYLKDANSRHNGRVATIMQERLDDTSKQVLAGYLA